MATATVSAGGKTIKRDIAFTWTGMDKKGNKVQGKSLAPDEAALRADLRRQVAEQRWRHRQVRPVA
ncbi:MAG TPA: hypothetical protein P5528_08545, partial [Steroidobacteraceae bacterium]|nr:hypothetical protein [Steroidobacteraceae bacterium]